ncbi:SGNH/GDSL hydrolase family protein [Gammaproteobacteria bacterium]|nr:SGNH/GDSL hydrolase family protein [Gammaproteobacteria bacterium]
MDHNAGNPKKKRGIVIAAICITLVICFLLVEGALRVHFARNVGTRVLAYGTPWYRNEMEMQREKDRKTYQRKYYKDRTVELHEKPQENYTKFFPNEVKLDQDPDTGGQIRVEINSRGFRGPEFDVEKGGVARVLTLGASSTFGYYNKDETTYPHLLQQYLNAHCDSVQFEVINFAIPHAGAAEIYAMFEAEGLELSPDFLTLYSGGNNAVPSQYIAEQGSILDAVGKAIKKRVLLVSYLAYIYDRKLRSRGMNFDAERAQLQSDMFLESVKKLAQLANEREIELIVASQQLKSLTVPREQMRGLTYAAEQAMVMAQVKEGDVLPMRAITFLNHAYLMEDLLSWLQATERGYVDIRGALDQHRDYLFTHVHLNPNANEVIAREFGQEILIRGCHDD